jgi:predicted KAP-like P-loop ATPase
VVVPYITTPRHVARFQNAISVTWPAVRNEVNLADFIALETLRLYEPGLFKAIRLRRSEVCGGRQKGDPDQQQNERFDVFLPNVPESRHKLAKLALQRLFPRLEATGYMGDWVSRWSSERRVCVEMHFDTYFRSSLSDERKPARPETYLQAGRSLNDISVLSKSRYGPSLSRDKAVI